MESSDSETISELCTASIEPDFSVETDEDATVQLTETHGSSFPRADRKDEGRRQTGFAQSVGISGTVKHGDVWQLLMLRRAALSLSLVHLFHDQFLRPLLRFL